MCTSLNVYKEMVALQKNLAGKLLGTHRSEFPGSVAVDGSQHKTLRAGVVWLNPSGDHCSRAAKGSCTCGFLLCSAWQEGPSEARQVGKHLHYKDNADCRVFQVSVAVVFHICPAFGVLLQFHQLGSQAMVFPGFSSAFVKLCALADKCFSVLL